MKLLNFRDFIEKKKNLKNDTMDESDLHRLIIIIIFILEIQHIIQTKDS